MDYEKLYKEAVKRAMRNLSNEVATGIFPELKESEDEKTRTKLLNLLKELLELGGVAQDTWSMNDCEQFIAWVEKQGEHVKFLNSIQVGDQVTRNEDGELFNLSQLKRVAKKDEKQGEQKPADKIEPKFKVGNWYQCTKDFFGKGVTFDKNTAYYCAKEGCLQGEYGCHIAIVKDLYDNFKLWTIEDAKEGDVLSYVTDEEDLWIMIYWSLYEPYEGFVHYYALLVNDDFSDKGTCSICTDDLKPATKEQRDLLFAKMHEAGYEWDADKKELKKIDTEIELCKTDIQA